MNIRRYRSSDRSAVWELHNVALRQISAHPGNGQWDRDLQCVEAEYLATGGEFYVGVIDERIVAMGALKRLTAGCAEIKRMRVDPRMQRRGLGAQMLRALERSAQEPRCIRADRENDDRADGCAAALSRVRLPGDRQEGVRARSRS